MNEAEWLRSPLTKADEEGIRQAAEILTNSKAVTSEGFEGLYEDDKGTITIGGARSVVDLYEQMATLRWSKITPATIPPQLRDNELANEVWQGLEGSRTNNIATEYFGKGIAGAAEEERRGKYQPGAAEEERRGKYQPRNSATVENAIRGALNGQDEASALARVNPHSTPEEKDDVRKTIMAARQAVEYLHDEVEAAVHSESPYATMTTGLRLARVLQYLKDNPPPPPEGGGKGEGGEGKGKGEGQGQNEGGQGKPNAPQEQDGKGDEGQGGESQQGQNEAEGSGGKGQPPPNPAIEQALEGIKNDVHKAESAAKSNVAKQDQAQEEAAKYGGYGAGGIGSLDPALTVFYGEVGGLPTVISESIRAQLASSLDASSSVVASLKRRGRLTNRAWRLGHGDFKVFGQPPKHKGQVKLLVDGSSSMGDNCDCHGLDHRVGHSSNGYLAWQVVGVIMARFPDAEVYVYTSARNGALAKPAQMNNGIYQCGIFKMKDGARPKVCYFEPAVGGAPMVTQHGTPDSNALVWFEEEFHQLEDVTLIHICDGQPNNAGDTYFQSHKMYDKGLRYASILVGRRGNHGDIYPSETTAHVQSVDDFGDMAEVIELAAARGA